MLPACDKITKKDIQWKILSLISSDTIGGGEICRVFKEGLTTEAQRKLFWVFYLLPSGIILFPGFSINMSLRWSLIFYGILSY
jgi:hypothetical protein